ncbi:SDR family oxidoreductase [Amycolatopsis sp. K13G38]|uniref:SDR family oxidoreductase n=1 Tax=Amycolatopsis acididurans TaxID=2724524 RepID=A0ABX1IXR1_9PSEU|nr:SDR family oxidoreductase [Amycolatopsis acididurans]
MRQDNATDRDPASLSGRTAVVTGGSSGIGEAIVRHARQRGARVAALDLEPTSGADLFVACDVSVEDEVRAAFEKVDDALGPADILVNNAGIAPPGRFTDLTTRSWERTLAVDLTGVFLCIREALPQLRASGDGSITNMGSIAGRHRSLTANAAYAAAKGGVIALTRQLAHELAPERVRVNCVCPGLVGTEIIRRNVPENEQADLARSIPMGRFAAPEEIATVTCFLASAAASYLTGAVVDVNGGLL